MHRMHSVLFHRATGAAFADRADAFLLGRASAIGGQRDVDAIWPGDLDTDFSAGDLRTRHVGGLRGALAGALSLALSNFPSYGSDIGGYRGGAPNEELLLRWAAMQAPLTIMQLGGGGDHHNPWLPPYTSAAVDGYRKLARLHIDLYPYLYTLAQRASTTGRPYALPPAAVFPQEAALDAVTDAFMVGDRLYAAPVLDSGVSGRRVRLPPGQWMAVRETLAGRVVHAGSREIDVVAAPGELPLFLKVGSAILLGMPDVITLTEGARASIKSGARWQGRTRVLWAPDLAAPVVAGQAEEVLRFAGEQGGASVGTRALTFTSEPATTEALLEIALAPGATPPVILEVNGAPLVAEAAADPATCAKCARWDPTGTLTLGLRGNAGAKITLR